MKRNCNNQKQFFWELFFKKWTDQLPTAGISNSPNTMPLVLQEAEFPTGMVLLLVTTLQIAHMSIVKPDAP